jgi:hypothetical protein
MTRNEKIGVAVLVWFFFFREKDASTTSATPHPVGPVKSTIVQPDGSEIDLNVHSTSSPNQPDASANVPLRNVNDPP